MSIRGRRTGITTTVPLEPFLSSESVPVDLNNLFIDSDDPSLLVEDAEVVGFPRNICTWIKGLHSVSGQVDDVVGVVRGDCSNTESLLETLSKEGKKVHPFSYPYTGERDPLIEEIERLCGFLDTDLESASGFAGIVEGWRALARRVDELRWKRLRITAEEAHLAMLSSSDSFKITSVFKATRIESISQLILDFNSFISFSI